MSQHGNESLAERVERLERDAKEVRNELRHVNDKLDRALSGLEQGKVDTEIGSGPSFALVGHPATKKSSSQAPERRPFLPRPREARQDHVSGQSGAGRSFGVPLDLGNLGDFRSGEWWLNKLGIGLLLFGVAFLYLLSVERGWIGPPVRVGFGLAVGAALLAIGLRVYEDRRSFAQVLLGGAVGTLYITGFAAFQLYALVPYPIAFAFMVVVTLLAYVLSLRQNEVPLSLIGTLGGLGTPFLLYNESGNLGGLVLYTGLILAGVGAVYFYKGWASLLAVSSMGGWLVLLVGYVSNFWPMPSPGERQTLQIGVAFVWLLFWLVPVAREIPHGPGRATGRDLAHLYVVSTTIVALGFTGAIWEPSLFNFGWITFSGAVLYALAALALRRRLRSVLSYTHALVALLLLTLTLVLMLEGNMLLLALAAKATVLHLVASRFSDKIVSAGAHLLFSAVALWLAARLVPGIMETLSGTGWPTLSSVRTLVDLAVIALVFVASGHVLPHGSILVYRVTAHAALLSLLWRELSVLPGGDAWVTVTWGLYAAGLLVAGLRLDHASLVRGGMATLFLVVGKLFLVDLTEVGAIWRVLLFLGFGGLFLALSYYLRSLWRPDSGERRDRHRSGVAEERA